MSKRLIYAEDATKTALEFFVEFLGGAFHENAQKELMARIQRLPSAQSDNRLERIADIVEGTIDHLDRDDAMDMLYQIKEVLK